MQIYSQVAHFGCSWGTAHCNKLHLSVCPPFLASGHYQNRCVRERGHLCLCVCVLVLHGHLCTAEPSIHPNADVIGRSSSVTPSEGEAVIEMDGWMFNHDRSKSCCANLASQWDPRAHQAKT